MAAIAILAAGYGVAINLSAFVLFGLDKRRAEAGLWRIRESTLIAVSLAGGWPGAKIGQRRFRHKTRKQPFAKRLNMAGLALLGGLLVIASLALWPSSDVSSTAGLIDGAFERLTRLLDGGAEQEAAPAPGPLPRRFGPGSGDGM